MKTVSTYAAAASMLFVGVGIFLASIGTEHNWRAVEMIAHEAEFETDPEIPVAEPVVGRGVGYTLSELAAWERPEGPVRVGLQVGHLDNESMPEELAGLEGNTGAVVGNLFEREVVKAIVELTAQRLRSEGIEVDILPATVPPGYVADAFVSVHADGNTSTRPRGFKIAGPRRDYSGQAATLVSALYASYGPATGLPVDDYISRRMTAYYAFNWPRYEHAIHPLTPAVIVETGFLTNAQDRTVIVDQPERAAEGIASGILAFLAGEKPERAIPELPPPPQFPLSGEIVCAPVRAERRDRDDGVCTPALATSETVYLIPEITSSTELVGQSKTIQTGIFVPIQTLDNYFWFQYEVAGFITESDILP